ncbi:MAG: prepilin-type N-terminal cleavage/methylation domain-containing protein [Steroidobacteraceae bacterium]
MLRRSAARGFTLVEALVALALMLAGLAGASLVLLQGVQYERESSNRRAAIRFAASLADELRALDMDGGAPIAADAPAIVAWIAAVEAALPAGSRARVEVGDTDPADYRILIEWPVAGTGLQRLVLAVTT